MKASLAKPEFNGATRTTILVVDGDSALSYLLERYARRARLRFTEVHVPWQTPPFPTAGAVALWLPSIERLEAVNPRAQGVGFEMPVIVCSDVGDEVRAHELGADVCAFHPLRYRDFLAALRAVGIVDTGDASTELGPAS